MAIDVLRRAPSTASSSARSAMPRYTVAISGSAHIVMATRNGSLPSPAGTTRPMRASGTNTPSRTVSWLWVGRMPRVSHVSTTVTPGLVRSTKACTICGPPGASASMAWAPSQRPRRAVGAELLAAGQAVAALDPLGAARRQQHGDVVAGLGVAGGEHLAVDRGLEDPAQRRVAGPLELGGDADPVGVHASSPARSPGRSGPGAAGWRPSRRGRGPSRRGARARRRRGSRRRAARRGPRGSRCWSGRARRPGPGSAPACRSAAR